METDALKQLVVFIQTERGKFENKHNNMFAQSFGQITKFYRYLLIIMERYESASSAFIENSKATQLTIQPGKHPLTNEQIRLHEEGWKLQVALELEIDSFYLIAKILLDRMAHAIEFYFGQATRCSLESHDGLTKCFLRYRENKNLTIPAPRLQELVKILKKEISDYRDYEIAHAKKPRVLQGISCDESGRTRKNPGIIYPKNSDEFVPSQSPRDLTTLVDEYLLLMISFIKENHAQTRLELLNTKVST